MSHFSCACLPWSDNLTFCREVKLRNSSLRNLLHPPVLLEDRILPSVLRCQTVSIYANPFSNSPYMLLRQSVELKVVRESLRFQDGDSKGLGKYTPLRYHYPEVKSTLPPNFRAKLKSEGARHPALYTLYNRKLSENRTKNNSMEQRAS